MNFITKIPLLSPPRIKTLNYTLNKKSGFDVFVRSKGEFKKVNYGAFSQSDAINFGAFKVGNTASASFKVVRSNNNVTNYFKQPINIENFYIKDGTYIEKRGKRIKSKGELEEITFKGIRKNRLKSIFNKRRVGKNGIF